MAEEVKKCGAFIESLKRNNKQIRDDRAQTIFEDAQMVYKREVEDIDMRIKRLKRERENMLDLSPTTAMSLVLATDFDAKSFIDKEIEIGIAIRNEEIKLDIATERYNYLFEGV